MRTCYLIMDRLDLFWRRCNVPIRFKINVWNAVVRAKLAYGIESLELIPSLRQKLDSFQLKGLRKIMNLKTTYGQIASNDEGPALTNNMVYSLANVHIGSEGSTKSIEKLSDYYQNAKFKLLGRLLHFPLDDPRRATTFDGNTLAPHDHGKKRVGKPRHNWVEHTTQEFWDKYVKQYEEWKYVRFNPINSEHCHTVYDVLIKFGFVKFKKQKQRAPEFLPLQDAVLELENGSPRETVFVRSSMDESLGF